MRSLRFSLREALATTTTSSVETLDSEARRKLVVRRRRVATVEATTVEAATTAVVPLLLFDWPELPGHARLRATADELFELLTPLKEVLSALVLFAIAHRGIVVRLTVGSGPTSKCAVYSAFTIIGSGAGFVIAVSTLVSRSFFGGVLSTLAETAIDITSILLGIFLASTVTVTAERAGNPIADVCTTQPISSLLVIVTELLGFFSLLRSILTAYARAPYSLCGYQLQSWLCSAVNLTLALVVQLSLLDNFIVPALGRATRQAEIEGTWLDDWLDAIVNASSSSVVI